MATEYTIAWTFGGYTTVEADSPEEAGEKFMEMDHDEILREAHNDGLDISQIYKGGES